MSVGEDVLSMPTIVLAFFSIFSCIYVMLSITESGYSPCKCTHKCKYRCCFIADNDDYGDSKQLNKSQQDKISMNNIIFFMCLTDLFQAMQIIFNWIPLAFIIPFWDSTSCKLLSIYAQYFAIQSPLWHCMLAYNLGYLILNGSINAINNLSKQRNYQYLIIIFIPLFSCILPIITSKKGINVYGVYINYNKSGIIDKECWLIIKDWQLVFAIVVFLSLIFHYIVLAIMCIKCHQNLSISHQYEQYIIIIRRLMRFVIVYTLIRFLPAMERIWGVSSNTSPPFWLVLSHHICIASVGICNGIVWTINQRDNKPHKHQNQKQKPLLVQHNNDDIDIDTTQQTETIYTSDITTTLDTNINLEDLRDKNMPLRIQ